MPKENSPELIGGAIVIGLIGSFLAFNGKRFFKPFLMIVGFSTGLTLTIAFMLNIEQDGSFFHDWRIIIPLVMGLVGAFLALKFYKAAVYKVAATGGYFLAISILAFKEGALIPSGWGRKGFISATVALCVFLANFFESFLTTLCSAIIGSFAVAAAVDVFVRTGFLETALEAVQAREIDIKMSKPAMGIAALFIGLIFVGVVTQYLTGSNKAKSKKAASSSSA